MPFVNYFADAERETSLNLAVGRVVLSTYLAWKVLTYEWAALGEWPAYLRDPYLFLAPHPVVFRLLPLEQWVVVGLLAAVAVGYRLGAATFLSALLLSHMGALMFTLNYTSKSKTFFTAAFVLLFFGLYRHQDRFSADALRAVADRSAGELDRAIRSPTPPRRLHALRWSLVLLAVLYFASGMGKTVNGQLLEWTTRENMNRYFLFKAAASHPMPVAEFIVKRPLLGWLSALGTVVLEFGFLPAVLAGVTITPFVVGLAVMHTVIALTLNPFFFDQYVLFLLFVPWDRLYRWWLPETSVDVVYDERSRACTRTLLPLARLDLNDAVSFHPRSDAPPRLVDRDGVDPESPMTVVVDGEAYTGREAFERLLGRYGLFFPLVWLTGVPSVGRRVYRRAVAGRGEMVEGTSRHE